MIPLNEMEARLVAIETATENKLKSWLQPAIYALVGFLAGVLFTLILKH